MKTGLYKYDMGTGVNAFSTMRDADLPYPVLQPHQTHGTGIFVVDSPSVTRDRLQNTDALITSLENFAIGVRTADCIPVLLYEPRKRVVAAVHAGWRGTVLRLAAETVERMHECFGTDPSSIVAQIGPGIGPESFQVGEDVVGEFEKAGFDMDAILLNMGPLAEKKNLPVGTRIGFEESPMAGGLHIDLWKANTMVLENAGVRNISVAGVCTYLRNDLFYSARRESVKCPRIITSIKLL